MSELYSNNDWRDYSELKHHGILGQKWGVKNGPPYPLDEGDHSAAEKKAGWKESIGKIFNRDDPADVVLNLRNDGSDAYKRIKNSSYANLDKWGKDQDHNILYITGISGSGKSTAAMYLAKKRNAEYVNLDSYTSMMSKESMNELQNKSFNKYLDGHVKGWRNVLNNDGKLNYKIVDQMAKASEDWSKELYSQNKKVIMEGVQLADQTWYENRSSYNDKPFMLINTSALASNYRGSVRDSENLLDLADLMITRAGYSIEKAKEAKKLKRDLSLKHDDID